MVKQMALLPFLAALLLMAVGAQTGEADQPKRGAVVDRPLTAAQGELLELAFGAASAIPPEADLPDRCKAQEAVLAACLKLHQPGRVLKDIEQIQDWRKGAVHADLAMYFARHGPAGRVQDHLDEAAKVAVTADDWRRDRIHVKIAQVHALLGQTEKAAQFEAGVEQSEQGKVIRLSVQHGDGGDFDAQIGELDQAASKESFDVRRNVLRTAVTLHDAVYPNADRRQILEKRIRSWMEGMPPFIQIEQLMAMARSAREHGDQACARELIGEAQAIRRQSRWMAEDEIPIMVRLAADEFRVGDRDRAQADVAAALAMFDAERERILSSKRTESLLLIAEAYHAMGNGDQAMAVYRRAVAEGASNPNGRPRALDLSALCRSLALNAVEPDAELWRGIREALNGLGPPW